MPRCRRRWKVGVAAAIIVFAFLTWPAHASAASADPTIRVELLRYFANVTCLTVTCNQPFTVLDEATGKVLGHETAGAPLFVDSSTFTDSSILPRVEFDFPKAPSSQIDSEGTDGRARLVPLESSGVFTISRLDEAGHAYRGALSISPLASGTLRIVNDIDLESYLMGVLKAEIGPSAPLEAMKAQAIAARSYTVCNMGRLRQEDADLDDTTRSQGYLGRDGETPNICRAVTQTSGQVLSYDGSVIDAMYSTDCGGQTAPGPPDQPYLQSVKDPLCANKTPWVVTLNAGDIEEALTRAGNASSTAMIDSLSIVSTDVSGRVSALQLAFGDGLSTTITGAHFRQAIGPNILRSTLFTLTEVRKGFWEFRGQGWGHGMGLCQAGAIARASEKKPEDCGQILAAYYPTAKLTDLTAAMVAVPTVAPMPSRDGESSQE